MAKLVVDFTLLIILSSISTLFLLLAAASEESSNFARSMSPESLVGLKPEKLTHLHFYFHDTLQGPDTTTIRIAAVPKRSNMKYQFGDTFIMDDALTVGPDLASEHVGRAQGVYSFASQTEAALVMVFTFAFTKGKYNGSNLSVLGRNSFYSPDREMPIVGGSGVFRFARGYVKMKTHMFNYTAGHAVIEYDVYVLH